MKEVFFLSMFLFVFSACKESESIDFGLEYFPMKEGSFVEYNVLEVFHDVAVNPQHDSLTYQLKTKIGEEFLDNLGRPVRKFFQFKYNILTDELIDQRVWTRVIHQGRGEVVEENQRLIRMVFAVKNDKEWDVNALTALPEQRVHYSNINERKIINSFDFEETVTVNYDDFFSLVDYRKKYEVYAKGVGLIERSFKDFTIQNFDTTDIQRGTEVHYQLINFGVE